ncbi:HalOD1 output domain-containing protein [Haloparvum sedimenti]|uniref:HalOD1 output domain-containing protein n=1 Tax=Haloparvum sedimenti TaxID=1678448 RepID=UPI00071E7379|nr:HalOD1 output domain-containing protein [Haloparvum sedimenti]
MSEHHTTETAASTDGESGVVVRQWDRSEGPLGSVHDALIEATGADPQDLPPLYDAVDPDALAAVLGADDRSERDRAATSITFVHGGCEVTVEASGRTLVSPIEDG